MYFASPTNFEIFVITLLEKLLTFLHKMNFEIWVNPANDQQRNSSSGRIFEKQTLIITVKFSNSGT